MITRNMSRLYYAQIVGLVNASSYNIDGERLTIKSQELK